MKILCRKTQFVAIIVPSEKIANGEINTISCTQAKDLHIITDRPLSSLIVRKGFPFLRAYNSDVQMFSVTISAIGLSFLRNVPQQKLQSLKDGGVLLL